MILIGSALWAQSGNNFWGYYVSGTGALLVALAIEDKTGYAEPWIWFAAIAAGHGIAFWILREKRKDEESRQRARARRQRAKARRQEEIRRVLDSEELRFRRTHLDALLEARHLSRQQWQEQIADAVRYASQRHFVRQGAVAEVLKRIKPR